MFITNSGNTQIARAMQVVPIGSFGNQVNPLLAQNQAMGVPLGNVKTLAPQQGRLVDLGKSPAMLDAQFNQQIYRDDRLAQNALQAEAQRQKNALEVEGVRSRQALGLEDVKQSNALIREGKRFDNNIELEEIKEGFALERDKANKQFEIDENDRNYKRTLDDINRREREAQQRWENNLKKEIEMRKASREEESTRERETLREDMQGFIPLYRKGLSDFENWFQENGKNEFQADLQNSYMAINHPGMSMNALTLSQANRMEVIVDRGVNDKQAKIEQFMQAMIRNPIPGFETELMERQRRLKDMQEEMDQIDAQIKRKKTP